MNLLSLRRGALAAAGLFVLGSAAPSLLGAQAQQPITLRFAAMVGAAPFACGSSYSDIGTSKSTIMPSEFRVFISGIELIGDDGRGVPIALEQDGTWQSGDVAMLDFENGTGPCGNGTADTRTIITGSVPTGRYTGVRFTLGVPFARNHKDLAAQPAPLSVTRMFWAWNSGHKFVRLDAKTATGKNWVLHLGSTGCLPSESATAPPTQCANGNRAVVQFDRINLDQDVIVADVAALYAGSNLEENQPRTAAGCMSGPTDADCGPIFARLGLPFGGSPAGPQEFLRVQPGSVRTAQRP